MKSEKHEKCLTCVHEDCCHQYAGDGKRLLEAFMRERSDFKLSCWVPHGCVGITKEKPIC
jgi:hypothetical protein